MGYSHWAISLAYTCKASFFKARKIDLQLLSYAAYIILNKIYARSLILDGACYVEDLWFVNKKTTLLAKKIQQ